MKAGQIQPALMKLTKINALACENDESLPLVSLGCGDTFLDLLGLTTGALTLARCPPKIECIAF